MADFELVRIANSTQTAEWWKEHNPVLYAGEIGFEIDTGLKKTGRGEGIHWNDIPYDINILPGKGKFSNQVISDPASVTNNSFSFKDKNPIAIELKPELNGNIEYGAIGDYSAVFGGKASAQGKRSFAEGTTTIAIGNYSHAEGDNCVTLGDDSHAEGYRNTTQGNSSHVEGANNLTIGVSSHAEGAENVAEGDASHAEGGQTHAEGIYSHAEGVDTHAQAKASHTEGEHTSTGGRGAHAEGIGTKADGMYQHVQGKFNIVDMSKAHIVGGGESVDKPRNIHTLDWDGNAVYAGDVYAKENKKLADSDVIEKVGENKTVGLAALKVGDYVTSINLGAATCFSWRASDADGTDKNIVIIFEDNSAIRSISTEDWWTYGYVSDYNADIWSSTHYDQYVIASGAGYWEYGGSTSTAIVNKKIKEIRNFDQLDDNDNPLIYSMINDGQTIEVYSNDFSIDISSEKIIVKSSDVFANNNKKLATEEWVKSDASGKLDAKGWINNNGTIYKYDNETYTGASISTDGFIVSQSGGSLTYGPSGITGYVDASYNGPFEVTDSHIVVNDKEFQYPSKSGILLVDKDIEALQNRIAELETAFNSITIGGSY